MLLVAFAGCSFATTAYRHVDRIILWKLDHYFDLNKDQRHDLAQRLTPLLERHRHEALPQYETFLQEVRQRVERGLTEPDIDWAYATYDRLRMDLFERVVADTHGRLTETAAKSQFHLGETYLLEKDYRHALAEYLKVEIRYKFPEWQGASLLQAAACYEALNEWKDAVKTYEDLLRQFPEHAYAPQAKERLAGAKKRAGL